jgi:S1-C subfamily serine protease
VASAGVRPLKVRLGAPTGTSAAILGFPGGGPYRVIAGRLGPTQTVIAQDSYGRGPFEKSVSALRGRVRPGNSGGPVVDRAGRVVTTVMLASPSKRRRQTPLGVVNGFGIPASVVHKGLRRADDRVGTGPCDL